ncbi:DUF1127 domain-containing protein [Inquilinus sp. Marseille-Q2685]|uniref:DUF1127 domain-containing protein n=1 Tax=Inquilinus sp. Marseille-Q2685 TaxID=2866581 RepID=UPI001CE40E76|nr:DUF1127 domain-containing protein [Inquilinus sp. Marseille-Q2685]
MTAPTPAARIDAAADTETVHRAAGWITAIASRLTAPMTRTARARRSGDALARFNDHMLQDIGLTRSDAVHTVLFGRCQPAETAKDPRS